MEKYISKIHSIISDIKGIELVSDTSNKVFKVIKNNNEVLYAKFYLGNSYHLDNEIKLYELVNNKYLKALVYFEPNENLAIFKELHGKTIDELSKEETNQYSNLIANAIYEFFEELANIKVNGYGVLNNNLYGKYNNFLEFLTTRQQNTSKELFKYPDLSAISNIIFEKYTNIIFSDNSLVPIDTNLKNIMITNDEKIKFIDPGELISGPILMGYGDIVAHTYKTDIYYKLINILKLNDRETKLLRIYAIFSSLNILAFLNKLNVNNLDSIKPYGNDNTFKSLIFEHLEHLNISNEEIENYTRKLNKQ